LFRFVLGSKLARNRLESVKLILRDFVCRPLSSIPFNSETMRGQLEEEIRKAMLRGHRTKKSSLSNSPSPHASQQQHAPANPETPS